MTEKEIVEIIKKRRANLVKQYKTPCEEEGCDAFFFKIRWQELGRLLDKIQEKGGSIDD